MILITSAKYVNSELQSEFGKIPPSFLPLGGKRLYEYQVKLFENINEKIVLSLPNTFDLSIFDMRKLKSLKIDVLFVPEGLSLGESITYSVNMNLPISDSLKILHGDTYFKYIEDEKDSVTISLVESSYAWTSLIYENKPLLNLREPIMDDNMKDNVLSGYFNISNPYKLIQALVKTKYSFINSLVEYSKEIPLQIIKNNTWLDFGLATNYFHSKKSITTQRAFNSLVIRNGYVEKTSTMFGKLDAEINWFEKFPIDLSLYIPRFYATEDNQVYKTEYLYTSTLSELYVFGKLPFYVWSKIFKSLDSFLKKLHLNSTEDININFDYKHKTNLRIKKFAKDNNIDLNEIWTFNGSQLPSLKFIIEDISNHINISKNNFKFIHGDFCFSNIMYDFKSNEIKTFDPRGIDFENKLSVYGDVRYDFAKMMHSVIGLYDFIISGFYSCQHDKYNIEFKVEVSDEVMQIQNTFLKVFHFVDNKEIYAIMIHLFISMLPLHDDDINKQFALLGNAFRLYEIMNKGVINDNEI